MRVTDAELLAGRRAGSLGQSARLGWPLSIVRNLDTILQKATKKINCASLDLQVEGVMGAGGDCGQSKQEEQLEKKCKLRPRS